MAGTGLQPLNIFLIVFPFVLSATILATEDILLIIAELFLIALTATVWKLVVVSYAGYHAADIPQGAIDQEQVRLWRFINNAIYNEILGLVKISFLTTLLKLRSTNRLIIASLWSLIIVNICFIFAATLGHILRCQPIRKYWQPEVPGHCVESKQYIFGVIGVTIGTDVLVALIPAWILYDLQMSLKNKIGVILFLSLPLTVTAIGCYRLHRFVIFYSLPNPAAEDPYNVRNALSNIEANLGVIAVCGPTIKWILGRFIPCFDTTRSTNAFTPNATSQQRKCSRGYVKSHDGIELQSNGFDSTYPRHIRDSCWRADDDADSEKQCITTEAGRDVKDIRATTVVEWKRTPSC
ncbi:hypothetical protein G6011_05530 [Alternaria panax]|uniref:Rhodopsin domain-containing protein n=1 Tax=Alternaria panax TaxID=48097 RepID=A0AAD4FBZ4_9PLEO|nr:hypothetical protein G6011_05530 [Alternaria panax]